MSDHIQNAKTVSRQWQSKLKTRPFCVSMLKDTRVLYFGLAQNAECHTIIQCEGQKDEVFVMRSTEQKGKHGTKEQS